MPWLAGVDGCKAGWFRACRHTGTGKLRFDLLASVEDLVETWPRPKIVALDMPIGLLETGVRACDTAARRLLGARHVCVFSPPTRAALAARGHAEARRLNDAICGRKISVQAWNLFPKLRAVDAALRADARLGHRIVEVHPEVSFAEWNGGTPIRHPKRKAPGRAARESLAQAWLGPDVIALARGDRLRKDVADDDLLDAIACLWTAHRIDAGAAISLPEPPERDAHGLPVRIVY